MRWKLLLITSILATIAAAGATVAVILAILGRERLSSPPDSSVTLTLLIPMAFSASAAVFVYRHTYRRRRLQAFLTVVLVLMLFLGVMIVISGFVR